MKREKLAVYIQCVGFLMCLLVVLLLLSKLMNPIKRKMETQVDVRDYGYVQACKEQDNTIDLIVIGDSESLTMLSTAKLWNEKGISSFIAGKSGELISETYFNLLELYKTQNPKLVIVETDAALKPFSLVATVNNTLMDGANYLFPIFRYHGLWKSKMDPQVADENHFRGFYIRNAIDGVEPGNYMAGEGEGASLPAGNEFYLDKILELCKEHNSEVLLVSAPSVLNCNYDTHMQMQKYADAREVSYIDMNLLLDEIGLDWSVHTMDKGDHINYEGTIVVTNYMLDYLERYSLPDHRGEPSYAHVQKAYDDFARNNPLVKEVEE